MLRDGTYYQAKDTRHGLTNTIGTPLQATSVRSSGRVRDQPLICPTQAGRDRITIPISPLLAIRECDFASRPRIDCVYPDT